MATPPRPSDQIKAFPIEIGLTQFHGSLAEVERAKQARRERVRKLAFWRRFKRPQ